MLAPAIDEALEDLRATLERMDRALADGPFICGERFTAADVYVGSSIGWGMLFGTIEKRSIFEDYWKRIGARPANLRARAIDDALAAKARERH